MAGNNDERINDMSERAKAELFNMRSRAMPPTPSFVRPISGRNGQNNQPQARTDTEQREGLPQEPANPEPTSQKKGLLGLDILKIFDAKGFKLDSDRILLLALILLLSGEGSDEILIFALCYLML